MRRADVVARFAFRRALVALTLTLPVLPAVAQDAPPPVPPGAAKDEASAGAEIVPTKWLVLEAPDVRARRPIAPSAVFARYLLDRDAAAPKEGDEVTGERGVAVKWTAADAKDGKLATDNVGVAFTTVVSDMERVVLAAAPGAATIWVNGEPFVGDVYAYGFPGVPVLLRKGENRIFVAGLRGEVRLVLRATAEFVGTVDWDATKPDCDAAGGAPANVDVGVVVVNAQRRMVAARVGNWSERGQAPGGTAVTLLPLSVAKVPCVLPTGTDPGGRSSAMSCVDAPGAAAYVAIPLDVREPGAPARVTRVSEIDGSVQEYAVVEPAPSLVAVPTRVVLSLHGAGVDCVGQARAYSRRPGFWIVCPTNRRPFGFDWQDWGRIDAYESLDHFGSARDLAVSRVFLTGHSMGGHGTWHLAANDPDRFVAIAPSAGWASFDTYAGGPRPRSMLWPLWSGADAASDTLALVSNLAPVPTYVVHGTADDNVPLGQAELMLKTLEAAGGAPQHHFQDGAGHWWDGDAAAGADCVDWPGIFAAFESSKAPPAVPAVLDWTSADLSVDARQHWIRALRPARYGEPVRIRATWDDEHRVASVTTSNATRINVAPSDLPSPWRLTVDGQTMTIEAPTAWLERGPDGWRAAEPHDTWKSPDRTGPLKRAFGRRFAFVLPTLGTDEEKREAVARVRFDAEQWWYRGNGFAEVVLDTDVTRDAERFEGRNLVLYGNGDTNAAWGTVLGAGPVAVERGALTVGDRRWTTDSAACFFVRPRADDATAVVAALADTGPRGCRLAMQHALFSSGTGYPDYVAWDERALTLGDGGVLAAGWFDAAWDLDGRGFCAFGGEDVRSPRELETK